MSCNLSNVSLTVEKIAVPATTGWTKPEEWPDISNVGDNEINLLCTDGAGIGFSASIEGAGTYSIDWGDGTVETNRVSDAICQHAYNNIGGTYCNDLGYMVYKVRLYGATGNIVNWAVRRHTFIVHKQYHPILWAVFGTKYINDYSYAFWANTGQVECSKLKACSISSLSSCSYTSSMFENCFALESVTLPDSWGRVVSVTAMFENCYSLKYITLPPTWDSIYDVTYMFYSCYALTDIKLPDSWGNVQVTLNMFRSCLSLPSIGIPSTWDYVTDVTSMFYNCSSIKEIKLPASWGNVLTATNMFNNCYSLKEVKLPSSWGAVTGVANMFNSCSTLASISLPIDSWGSVTTTAYMFYGCLSLAHIKLPASWGNVQTVTNMFTSCNALTSIILPLSWGNIITTNSMFNSCFSLSSVVLPSSLGSITDASSMFSSCFSLTKVNNIECIGSNVGQCNCADILKDCENLQQPIVIGTLINQIGIYGNSSYILKVNSIRLTNIGSKFTGSSPQINVSYCSLSRDALVALFGDLPVLTSKAIRITGCTGAASLTAADRLIATSKGWSITG